ncbi:MAG: hypothetical protein QNK03_00075 [Myxococcota bacterium]|nr:hypothetical protein [Myxococcota bacterium]
MSSKPWWRWARRVGEVALLLAAAVSVVGAWNGVRGTFDHNEHMYVMAGVLTSQGERLYRDFPYVQMPYLPLLYGALFRFVEPAWYYATAKIVSTVAFLGSGLVVFLAAWWAGRRQLGIALLATCLFLTDLTLVRAFGEASNYATSLFFSLASVLLFLRERFLLAGLCVAISVGLKLYHVVVLLPLVPLVWRSPRALGRLVAGGAIGGGPLLVFALPDLADFWFYNLEFHRRTTVWIAATGFPAADTAAEKWALLRGVFGEPGLAAVTLGFAGVGLASLRVPAYGRERLLVGGLLAVGLFTAVALTPSYPQYLALPVSLLMLAIALALGALARGDDRASRLRFVALCAGAAVALAIRAPDAIERAFPDERVFYPTELVARESRRIRELIAPGSLVATLSPIAPLGAGMRVHPEFATGPFLYYIGDEMTAEERRAWRVVSAATLDALLEREPPDALFLGYEPRYEHELRRWAAARGLQRRRVLRTGLLYVDPAAAR